MSQAPDEIVKLKAMLMKLQQENQALAANNQALESKLDIISAEVVTLKDKLELALAQLNLNRAKRFGVQSEKVAKGTFNEAEQNVNTSLAHHKKGRQPLPDNLPRDVKTYAIDEPICVGCGHALHACGVEESE
jgi:predicted nuclease with TOPRIM domain